MSPMLPIANSKAHATVCMNQMINGVILTQSIDPKEQQADFKILLNEGAENTRDYHFLLIITTLIVVKPSERIRTPQKRNNFQFVGNETKNSVKEKAKAAK